MLVLMRKALFILSLFACFDLFAGANSWTTNGPEGGAVVVMVVAPSERSTVYAVTGAGKIHTDFAKRFVRAEVVGYDDYRRVGSMKEAKNQGVYRLEGKTYIVQDGDIMHIL